MNYTNTHMRLYVPPLGVSVGGSMLSNNIEIGYRWGTYTLHDLTMTRQSDAGYTIGYNTFEVMSFTGTDSRYVGGWTVNSYSVQVTDFYDKQSGIWLGSVTLLHDYSAAQPDTYYYDHTITRQLEDIDYIGEPPDEDRNDFQVPYDIWKDPMLWVAVGVVAGIIIGFSALVLVMRKRSREWQLAEIEKFEADRVVEKPMPPTDEESM